MAFEIQKVNPLDLQPRKAIGVSVPFSAAGVFNLTYQTKDAIRNNLVNFFLTGIGERYLNVNFGTGLRNLLFEQLTQDKIEEVREIVTSGLEIYFPRVIPTVIEVKGSPGKNSVNFFMSYAIQDSNIEDELLINFAI